VRAKNPGLRYL